VSPRLRRMSLLVTVALWSGLAIAERAESPGADQGHSEFTFTRIRYGARGSGRGFGRNAWAHDYPLGDEHLSRILDYTTFIRTHLGPTNVFDFDNPALFEHPIAYVSEPGFWSMTEGEVQSLRRYALKGGFLIFDDFEAEQWDNFEQQIHRALPEYQLIEIDVSHPIFHSFFELKQLAVKHPLVAVTPVYFGMFEDNDPRRRMIAIVNYNNDLAEYWEFSDKGMFAIDDTNDAYKLAVNYIVYGMTH